MSLIQIENMLRAPYPTNHAHHKTIYEQCGKLGNTDLYYCNCCKIKLLGDKELLEHNNKNVAHQAEIETLISKMLDTSMQNNQVQPVKISSPVMEMMPLNLSFPVKQMMGKAAIESSKMQLAEEMAELKIKYRGYHEQPNSHPMYQKEWHIFYLRRCSELLAYNLDPNTHNFAKDWTTYWARRIEVYFNKDLRNIIWRIGSKHDFKVQKSDRLNGDAAADRNRTILNKKPKRVIEIYDSESESQLANEFDVMPISKDESESELKMSPKSQLGTNSKFELTPETLSSGYKSDSDIEIEMDSDEFEDCLTSKRIGNFDFMDEDYDEHHHKTEKATAENSVVKKDDHIHAIVAEKVMKLLQDFGLNVSKMSDEQVDNYIKYVFKIHFPHIKYL